MTRALVACVVLDTLCLSSAGAARVLSHSPVTSAIAVPAVQKRTNRYFLLIVRDPRGGREVLPSGSPVLFDSTGIEPPRTLLPFVSGDVTASAAYREDIDGTQQILLCTTHRLSPGQTEGGWRFLYSRDGGRAFTTLDPTLVASFPAWAFSFSATAGTVDSGGPTARSALSGVRPGTRATPFVFLVSRGGQEIVALSDSGEARRIFPPDAPSPSRLQIVGSNAEGSSFLVAQELPSLYQSGVRITLFRVGIDGASEQIFPIASGTTFGEGFITSNGGGYISARVAAGAISSLPPGDSIAYVENGSIRTVVSVASSSDGRLVAVPTAAFDGAWIAESGGGRPTLLSLHRKESGLVEQWRDLTAPGVEAIHAAASGQRLLVQIRRAGTDAATGLALKDPAIAIWEVGQPAPPRYDDLLLSSRTTKGFVNLDVDRVAEGGRFVFDGGENHQISTAGGPSGCGCGADLSLEFSVVRSSLAQQLVIPAVARAAGANASFWRSDLSLRNPGSVAMSLQLAYVPTVPGEAALSRRITLAPNEIRVLADVLGGTFGLQSGSGALFLTPEGDASVDATSRTYTRTERGTLGTGIPAFDVFTAAHALHPARFSAAFQGAGFRTNLVAARTSGPNGGVLAAFFTPPGTDPVATRFGLGEGSHVQVDDLVGVLGLRSWETGALTLSPEAGEAVGAVLVIDDTSNDPTFFGPDTGVSGVLGRTIPAIVHAEGANGTLFRTDLFLTNPTDEISVLYVKAVEWHNTRQIPSIVLVLLPRETRVIRDVLAAAFNASGVALLELSSGESAARGVRVASRTYTAAAGGSYGLSMPPLGSFQRAGAGEALEILGAMGGAGFRTNVALVELSGKADGIDATIEIVGDRGQLLDSFVIRVPGRRGYQIDDLFESRALASSGATLIRIRPHGGSIGAYATLIDNGTNDPVFFGANLAARD